VENGVKKDRLLIIEDEASVAKQLKWALGEAYEIAVAGEAHTARKLLRAGAFAVATLDLGPRPIRLASAHLDPRGPVGHKWLGAAGRAVQMRHLLEALSDDTVVLGADLNLGRGRAEPAWRSLQEAGFRFGVPPVLPGWRHTYHALPRLVLDYIMVRDRRGVVAGARVHRLDEDAADRGPTVFGSDHHPLLARIDLQ